MTPTEGVSHRTATSADVPAIAIRPARRDDARSLARLRHEFRAQLGDPSEEEEAFVARCAEWMAERLADGARWRAWVAVAAEGTPDETIVGTVWVGSIEKMPNPAPEPEEHAYVTNVYVRPEARGRRIGTALLEAALAWCEERGIHAAILWSTRRSAPLYRRHGFAEPEAILERSFGEGPRR